MFCKKCGNEIGKNEKFCGNCGQEIEKDIKGKLKNKILMKYKKLIIGVLLILIGFIGIVSNELSKVRIPHLKEETVKAAKEEAERLGLNLKINGSSNNNDIVISQTPEYNGEGIKKGSTINVNTVTKEEFEKQKKEEERRRNRPSNDTIIGCAQTAIRRIANYEPEFGTTRVLEEDNYGRYLVSCYAKLVNGFGAGKYNVYYVVLSEVTKQDGEWYYKINPANGIINSGNYGSNEDLAIESAKKLNEWNEPKESDTNTSNN